jgi:uncharacterized protein YjlB
VPGGYGHHRAASDVDFLPVFAVLAPGVGIQIDLLLLTASETC